ncbi:MAG: Trm112 family protein [Candidatus Micropelagos thuwalensis]|nr:Trm112 family protein [Candidatus Micropelagos thuwalensis]
MTKENNENFDAATPDLCLLEILVCPVSRRPLTYDRGNQELISKEAGLAYPIRQGIPVMLESEARKISKD